jgi:hypothetical protein
VNRALSEGRKAFAKRLAGIESGAECDRLAPQLSALADGEPSAENMSLLRPHLRTCLACRARLREYRTVPARVAAVAPPVAVGCSLLDSARYLLDAVSGWLSARAPGLAARWQQATELATAHKAAAVVASAAVLGGGGAATVAGVDGGDHPAAVRPTAGSSVVPSAPAPTGNKGAEPRNTTAPGGGATGQAAPRDETAPADRDPAPTGRPAGESSEPTAPTGEFRPDPPPAEPAAPKPE